MKKLVSGLLAAAMVFGSAVVLPESAKMFDSAITASASTVKDGRITDKKFLKNIAWYGESAKKIDGVKGYMSTVFKNSFNDEEPVASVLSVDNDYEYCYDDIWYSNTYRYSGTYSSLSEMYVMEPMLKKDSNNNYAPITLKGTVKIKSKVNGMPVKQIQALAFYGQKKITKLVIPEGIEYIGVDSLNQMDGLKKLYLPKSLKIAKDSNSIGFISDNNGYHINKDLTIYCWNGSDAHKFAKEMGFKYKLRDKSKANIKYLYSKGKATVSNTSYVYDGKAKKPAVKNVKYGKTKLKKGTDYTVSYRKNKKAGIGTVVIKGKGKYDGIIKKDFKIKPKATTIKSVKSPYEEAIKVSYKKSPTVNTYEIAVSTDKSFKNKNIYNTTGLSETIEGLASGETYYVKVRPYFEYYTNNNEVKFIYGKYSDTVNITVK